MLRTRNRIVRSSMRCIHSLLRQPLKDERQSRE